MTQCSVPTQGWRWVQGDVWKLEKSPQLCNVPWLYVCAAFLNVYKKKKPFFSHSFYCGKTRRFVFKYPVSDFKGVKKKISIRHFLVSFQHLGSSSRLCMSVIWGVMKSASCSIADPEKERVIKLYKHHETACWMKQCFIIKGMSWFWFQR